MRPFTMLLCAPERLDAGLLWGESGAFMLAASQPLEAEC